MGFVCIYQREYLKFYMYLSLPFGLQSFSSTQMTESNFSFGSPAAVCAPCFCQLSNMAVWSFDRTEVVKQSVVVRLRAALGMSTKQEEITWLI